MQPKLRFKGFTDDWEKRKLESIFKERTERSSEGTMLSVTINDGVVLANSLSRKNVSSSDKSNYKLVRKDDIAYNSMRMWQSASGVSNYEGIVSPAYTVLIPEHDVNSSFFGYYFKRTVMKQVFQKNSQGLTSDTWNLKYPLLKNIVVQIPSIEEQIKISEFLKQVDKLIAVNQRKVDLLKKKKAGYLQKLFPRNGQNKPELRFKGYTDAWEKRKLGELTKRVTRKNINNESTLPLTISAQYGLIDQNIFFDKQVASKDVSSYFLIKNGEFAYNKSYSNGYPLGAIKRLDRYPNGVLSTLYIIFKPISVSSQFLVSYFDSTHWYKEVAKNAAEGARNHGLLNISPSDFFNMVQTIPNNFEEQNKVGIFFETLDNIIAVNQRKVDLLKKEKKSLLQKMFV